ncbi:hypothetical protein QP775_17325 [Paenibacillus sp. UMB4589-SE434]|nr:hypothetical protein [Paenibacillus sp. UMB4589-SE434]
MLANWPQLKMAANLIDGRWNYDGPIMNDRLLNELTALLTCIS